MSYFRAEIVKMRTLPSVWLSSILALVIPTCLATINAYKLNRALESGETTQFLNTSTSDIGFGHMIYGSIGAVIIGVVVISSEYTKNSQNVARARQLSTTMVVMPDRAKAVTAKLCALCTWVLSVGTCTTALTLMASRYVLGSYAEDISYDYLRRFSGIVVYWTMMAVISAAFTVIVKNGVLPLVVLITNCTVISFSRLLALITDLARFLPDTAALSTFLTDSPLSSPLSSNAAFLVCLGWTVLAYITTLILWIREDV